MAADNKQVFDVAKPGKSAPSPTSRPVIVNHGPMMKDPMVSESETKNKEGAKQLAPSSQNKVIAPLGDNAEKSKNEPGTTDAPEKEKPQTENTDRPEAAKPDGQSSDVDAAIDAAAKKKKVDTTEEDIVRQAELEKLVEEKKYFVPINEVTRRHHQHLLWAAILLIGLLAGIYLALDAGVVDSGINLPVEFLN